MTGYKPIRRGEGIKKLLASIGKAKQVKQVKIVKMLLNTGMIK